MNNCKLQFIIATGRADRVVSPYHAANLIFDNTNYILYCNEYKGILHENIVKQYGRVTDLIYYDVTNYYFEIDMEDDLRKRGPCKEKKHDPIVQI